MKVLYKYRKYVCDIIYMYNMLTQACVGQIHGYSISQEDVEPYYEAYSCLAKAFNNDPQLKVELP